MYAPIFNSFFSPWEVSTVASLSRFPHSPAVFNTNSIADVSPGATSAEL